MRTSIAAFYRFTPLADLPALQARLRAALSALSIYGTLLLAPEGVNGTLAGEAAAIEAMLDLMARHVGVTRDQVKFSIADHRPFHRLKIRLKKEIITFGQPQADPLARTGTPVAAKDWNALIDDPDVIVLDTRNRYETLIGRFDGAVDPAIDHFTDFAAFARGELAKNPKRKIAMYCTGGIRCEKASAFLLSEGFAQVYQLSGGILKYLEEVPAADSRWRGDCYVFDRRIAVGHDLAPSGHAMCFSCGYPLTDADRAHPSYEEGVACARCAAATSAEDKRRFRMRQQQSAGSSGGGSG